MRRIPRAASCETEWKGPLWYPTVKDKGDTDLVLVSDAIVRGVVTDAGGSPLPGAEVRFALSGKVWTYVKADDAGAFEVVGLEPGVWRVTVNGEGYAAEAGKLVRDARAIAEFPIRFVPGCIRGRVLDEEGAPRRNGYVVLGSTRWLNAKLGPDGEFAFWGLPEGDYAVNAYFGGSGREVTLQLHEGEIRDLELQAERPRSGMVELDVTLPDGTHPDGLQLFLSSSRFSSVSAAPPPIAPGRFRIRMRTGVGRITIGATRNYGAAEISVRVFESQTRVVVVALPPPGEYRKIDATR